ncbi:hypothetical protein NliqN6_5695 [Naganishia liquefaciens]|uniref:GDT1 family protein n=1 Tax=Naganishia liquefaciens TaxID=104408 RepID=A0A8H3TYA9_9TREE|nr:hypothetical protein NliqN6_5695 [Naganishia liquefaciens]
MDQVVEGTPLEALTQSFIMILVSEIGDKTFLIAAIMATRHPRMTVFTGAFASLMVMSILSAAMGKVILGFVPAKWTHYIAALLFLVFGVKMLQEGLAIPAGSSHIQEEMREVEDELEEEEGMMDIDGRKAALDMEEGHANGNSISLNDFAKPSSKKAHRTHPLSAPEKSSGGGVKAKLSAKDLKNSTRNFCGLFFSPVFAQAFILTFLGEWGDRSQIATIALAGVNDIFVVAFGTIAGHFICTGIAVLGGRLLATKISVRTITLVGAVAFLGFAVVYAYEGYTDVEGASL